MTALLLTLLLSKPMLSSCDASLWHHVYNPQRLTTITSCITVTGTIVDATAGKRKDGVRHEADGDTHGWLKPDPAFVGLVNDGNRSAEGGNLVYEVVCAFHVKQQDAKAACRNYTSPIKLLPVGTHVAITGTFVRDSNHAQWNEIHPVSSIVRVPK